LIDLAYIHVGKYTEITSRKQEYREIFKGAYAVIYMDFVWDI